MQTLRRFALVSACLLLNASAPAAPASDPQGRLLRQAQALAKAGHAAEARAQFGAVLDGEADWRSVRARQAVQAGIACAERLDQWDDAFALARELVSKSGEGFEKAVALRYLAGLHQRAPHNGSSRRTSVPREDRIRSGMGYYSADEYDYRQAVQCYEQARLILAGLPARPADKAHTALLRSERIGVAFDLAGLLVRGFDNSYRATLHHRWWAEQAALEKPGDPQLEQQWRTKLREAGLNASLPLDAEGRPVALAVPASYDPQAGEGRRILFLLAEVERLDDTETREDAATALLRRALLARALYGPEPALAELEPLSEYSTPPPAPPRPLEALAEDEALVLVARVPRIVRLPESENPLLLLREVGRRYPKSRARLEAELAEALHFQSRRQFPAALALHERFLARHKGDVLAREARSQRQLILRPEVRLPRDQQHPSGSPAEFSFDVRNARRVEFEAVRLDHPSWLRQQLRSGGYTLRPEETKFWSRHRQGSLVRWSVDVPQDGRLLSRKVSTRLPATPPGFYLVQARATGMTKPVLGQVIVTDTLTTVKYAPGKLLAFLQHTKTGKPLAGRRVTFLHLPETDSGQRPTALEEHALTDADGLATFPRGPAANRTSYLLLEDPTGQVSWTALEPYRAPSDRAEPRWRGTILTDRPVYRPGETVQFRLWLRERAGAHYLPPTAGREVQVVFAPGTGSEKQAKLSRTDEAGGVSGEFVVPPDGSLGTWRLSLEGKDLEHIACRLKVEEYRRPEFEATAQFPDQSPRLGAPFKAVISARYLFGAPLTQGRVEYRVERTTFDPGSMRFDAQGVLDGDNRGDESRMYPWLPWSNPPAWPGSEAESDDERAAAGQASLQPDGTVEIEIPAAKLAPTYVYHFRLQADVTDLGRRTQQAVAGLVLGNRQFVASLQPERSWLDQPGSIRSVLQTRALSGQPMAAEGELQLFRLEYGGPAQENVQEHLVATVPARTGADGSTTLECNAPGPGQYRLRYSARDRDSQLIEANAIVWVGGPDFDGRKLRFKDLELITDRASYRVGETARVLLATRHEAARVLLADDAAEGLLRKWRFVDVAQRTVVLELPIEAGDAPHRHLEATLVRDGKAYSASARVAVQRDDTSLAVTVQTDRPTYRPGENAQVLVTARGKDGQPARGEVVLRGWDDALRAFTQSLHARTDFHPDSSYHRVIEQTSLGQSDQRLARFFDPADVQFEGRVNWLGKWRVESLGQQLAEADATSGFPRRSIRIYPPGLRLYTGPDIEPTRVIVTGSYIGGPGQLPTVYSATAEGSTPVEGLRQLPSYVGNTVAENDSKGGPERSGVPAPSFKSAALRSNFRDALLWLPRLPLASDGTATTAVTMPDSLTRWRLEAAAISPGTQVGEGSATATVTKSVLVRLLSPRFYLERDEVVVSSIAHNYLDRPQLLRAELTVPRRQFEPMQESATRRESGGEELTLTAEATVPAKGEHRFDWPLRALQPGTARLVARALTTEESDAVQHEFPVLVHGIPQQRSQAGAFRAGQDGTRTLTLELPQKMDPGQTALALTLTPSLAHVIVEALPFLADYPYGCVEQTMSRFFPAAVVQGTLQRLGTTLEALGKSAAQDPRRAAQFRKSPVFDSAELARMIRASLERIKDMQRPDGGWGWWAGDEPSLQQSAYVLHGLLLAKANGIRLPADLIPSGRQFLASELQVSVTRTARKPSSALLAEQVFAAYVLGLEPESHRPTLAKVLPILHRQRSLLSPQGLAILALAHRQAGRSDEAAVALRNLLQFVTRDEAGGLAWIRSPGESWWRWWQNDIETNAWALHALAALQPKGELAPLLAKWLVQNRRGQAWRSTRDTALTLCALGEYLRASGEEAGECRVQVSVDGGPAREQRFERGGFAAGSARLVLGGPELAPGPHTITLTKSGRGALYYTAMLDYFTHEEQERATGSDIAVERAYFRVGEGTARTPLQSGESVRSGEQIEVVLTLKARNDYDFLAFEDRKPAGCEPVEIFSGSTYADGFCANVELRESKVVFFVAELAQGEHELRYRLRAETPGTFRAPPATGFAMYAPELRANSTTMRLKVE